MFEQPTKALLAARSAIAWVLLATTLVPSANAASAVGGHLTCTTTAVEAQNAEGFRPLTCSFQQANGKTARFDGAIERSGADSNDTTDVAKRVFVWVVHGPPGLDADDLTGIFVRRNPPAASIQPGFENALVDSNGAIALVPASGKEQVPGNPAVTVLQLSLKAIAV
jgi:hypothetical protein